MSEKPPRKPWEDLMAGAFEKLRDPAAALDWFKGIREDVQSRFTQELTQQIEKIDWNTVGKSVGEHLAENYDLEIHAKISLKPKKNAESSDS